MRNLFARAAHAIVAAAMASTLFVAAAQAEKLRIDQWRDKEASRDAVRVAIRDFLWSDETGLPEAYTEEDVQEKSEDVFRHVFRAYPTVPSPFFADAAGVQ